MIATCPHCQSGFYITPELAGKVINCSKCKKPVRAPDRRRNGSQATEPPDDGIPVATVAETKGEIEERLKAETEAKQELEKKLKTVLEEKERAEQAKAELEARLQNAGGGSGADPKALTEVEEKLKQALEEKTQAQEQVKAESSIRAELEEKLKQTSAGADTELRALKEIEAKLKETIKTKDEMEKKLRDETSARKKAEAQAECEATAKAEIEKLLKAELEARTKAESKLKPEASAKRKMQALLDEEIEARKNAEKLAAAAKARLRDLENSSVNRQPVNLCRGLRRLCLVLSPVAAIITGVIAYNRGYVLLSPFDRPVRLPFFGEPVYLPLMTLALSAAGLAAVWAVYLVIVFVFKGFRRPKPPAELKRQPAHQQTGEIAYAGGTRMWRSS